jgi:hypothetical protein
MQFKSIVAFFVFLSLVTGCGVGEQGKNKGKDVPFGTTDTPSTKASVEEKK